MNKTVCAPVISLSRLTKVQFAVMPLFNLEIQTFIQKYLYQSNLIDNPHIHFQVGWNTVTYPLHMNQHCVQSSLNSSVVKDRLIRFPQLDGSCYTVYKKYFSVYSTILYIISE